MRDEDPQLRGSILLGGLFFIFYQFLDEIKTPKGFLYSPGTLNG